MTDMWVILGVTLMMGLIVYYLIRQKKQGKKCIGCPYAGKCTSGRCGDCSVR